ncbi:MAG: hypothetical protein Q9220_005948 [cf. Caloplaca sp. 1 TL-2023]
MGVEGWLLAVHHGFGKHINALPPTAIVTWFKLLYAFEFLYTLGMAGIKYSVLCFMYRIFPIIQFRRLLQMSSVFVTALTIACVLTSVFQCIPIQKFWETLAGALAPLLGGRCINVRIYFLITGSINTLTDFSLLALPIPMLGRLRTGTPQKLMLTTIFSVGLTVCAVSIVRLVLLANVDVSDITCKSTTIHPLNPLPFLTTEPTGNYVPTAIWTAAEPSIAVVSACLPSFRPLFVRIVWGRTHRPKPPPPAPSSSCRKPSIHSWRSTPKHRSGSGGTQGSFNRLQEFSSNGAGGGPGQWRTNSVSVFGGKNTRRGSANDHDRLEMGSDGGSVGEAVPWNRIRAKTEVVVNISERVDWQDDLF